MKKFLLGTGAYNPHVQNIARALNDSGALYEYATGGVDVFHHPMLRGARQFAGAVVPGLNRELSRRAIVDVPVHLVRSRWRWEIPRVAAARLGWDERLIDWIWDRGERDLDRALARLVAHAGVEAFLGVEYGALAALQAAKRLGKPAIVAFLSPHHRTLATWVDTEYKKFPELLTREQLYFDRRKPRVDERKDAEAALADLIVTNSTFTTDSLVQAGFPADKMLTVPLGGPAPVRADALPRAKPAVMRLAYVGPVSVRKGAHYLLRAWRDVARPGVELHLYGSMMLPDRLRREAEAAPGGASITFHGSVPAAELSTAYLESSALVLPTLCDGFGMVVSEALAHGLPVITTRNAGAADAVAHGRTGFVIPAADAGALATALTWCADHPDELFEMRRPALAAAARWTWADFRQRFIELLRAGMEDRSSSFSAQRASLGIAG